MVEGDAVNLIDEKAGIEHFGRRIPDRMDIILGVLDCTLESISIARRMDRFCKQAAIKEFWLILNKIESEEIKSMLVDNLAGLKEKVIGSITYDQDLIRASLSGDDLGKCKVSEEVERILKRLEQVVSFQ